MAARRWEKPVEENLTGLLEEAGYDDANPAPTLVRLMGEQIARGGSGAVAAAREFMRLTRQPNEQIVFKAEPGSVCPTCKQIVINAELAALLAEIARDLRASGRA